MLEGKRRGGVRLVGEERMDEGVLGERVGERKESKRRG